MPVFLGKLQDRSNIESVFNLLSEQALEEAIEYLTDPIHGSPAQGRTIEGIVTIHIDVYLTGSESFSEVVQKLRKDFEVGHEDVNDAMFVGQHIQWKDKGKPSGWRADYVDGRWVESTK